MKDIFHFVIYYAKQNEPEAQALKAVLEDIDLKGGLYDRLRFKNEKTALENTAAQIFLCSQYDWGINVQRAKDFFIGPKKEDSLIVPVYLSPGKNELLHSGSATNRGVATANVKRQQAQIKHQGLTPAKRLTGFSSLDSINVYKPIRNYTYDIEVIKSPELKSFIEQKLKQSFLDRQQLKQSSSDTQESEERKKKRRHNVKEFPVGLDEQGSYQKHIAPERATGIDTLGHEKLAKKMVEVMIESTQFDTPAIIGIFAQWGSGKSRFIKFIKEYCSSKPDHFYLSSSDVNCCLRDNSINWCCKLFLYVLFSIVITVSTLAIIGFVIRNSEQTVQDDKCSNHSEIITNNTTTTQPCLHEISEPLIHYDFWSSTGICLAILIAILILFLALCQRKVWHDWKATCQDCCYCYDETCNRGRHDPNTYLSVPLEDGEYQGRGRPYNCCLDTRTLCYMSFFQRFPQKADQIIRVITVECNALELVGGCDNLLAGIVTTLGSVVEEYFGKWTVRICRIILKRYSSSSQDKDTEQLNDPRSFSWICCKLRHKLYVVALLLGYIIIVSIAMVALIASQYEEPFKESSMYIFITTTVPALGALLAGFGTVIKFLTKSTKGVVGQIRKEMLDEDFRDEPGFKKIKQEVHHITKIINYMSTLYGCHFRVLLIINDFDRCQPNGIMGILHAVNMVLEPKNDYTRSPYVSILTIDQRLVLGAIERHFDPDNRGDLSNANINWYEYLKERIHLQFFLPALSEEKKFGNIIQLHKRKNYNRLTEVETANTVKRQGETNKATTNAPESDLEERQGGAKKETTNAPESDQEERQDELNEEIAETHRSGPEESNDELKEEIAETHRSEPEESNDELQEEIAETHRSGPEESNDEFKDEIAETHGSGPEESNEPSGNLLDYIHDELEDPILLQFINGNPRTLKRIYNFILLALHLCPLDKLNCEGALNIILVVIMVEQWPFRTSLLHQYYMNKIQKRRQTDKKDRHVGDLVIRENYIGTSEISIDSLKEKKLLTLWKEQQTSVMNFVGWKKYFGLDYDPELFDAFLDTYRLQMKHLSRYLPYAVNHDTNMESIVEQGLAELHLKAKESISKKTGRARYESA